MMIMMTMMMMMMMLLMMKMMMMMMSTRRAADPGPGLAFPFGAFSRSSHASDLKIDTLVATRSGAWRYRVSAKTDWPDVSIL